MFPCHSLTHSLSVLHFACPLDSTFVPTQRRGRRSHYLGRAEHASGGSESNGEDRSDLENSDDYTASGDSDYSEADVGTFPSVDDEVAAIANYLGSPMDTVPLPGLGGDCFIPRSEFVPDVLLAGV